MSYLDEGYNSFLTRELPIPSPKNPVEGENAFVSGSLSLGSLTTQIGKDEAVFKVSKDGLQLGDRTFADAEFHVTPEGAVTATSANINGTELTFQDLYGDGSDGTIDINSGSFSSGPITNNALTRDAYFTDLTLSGGNLNTAGYKIFGTGTLTINSSYKIHREGNAGVIGTTGQNGADGQTGGAGGAGGAALAAGSLPGTVAGVVGGAGGNG